MICHISRRRTVSRAPTTIGITLTFMSFSFSLAKPRILSLFSRYFIFPLFAFSYCNLWSPMAAKYTRWQVLFFLFINVKSVFLAGIWWSVRISKSQRILCPSFSRKDHSLCQYHLFVWSNFDVFTILCAAFLSSSYPESCFFLCQFAI